nr:hypothetical protein Iba_scaffold686CG0730 [Ipomoea batatas]
MSKQMCDIREYDMDEDLQEINYEVNDGGRIDRVSCSNCGFDF